MNRFIGRNKRIRKSDTVFHINNAESIDNFRLHSGDGPSWSVYWFATVQWNCEKSCNNKKERPAWEDSQWFSSVPMRRSFKSRVNHLPYLETRAPDRYLRTFTSRTGNEVKETIFDIGNSLRSLVWQYRFLQIITTIARLFHHKVFFLFNIF